MKPLDSKRRCCSHGTNGRSGHGQQLRTIFFSCNDWFECISGSREWALVGSISRLVEVNVTFSENERTFDLFPSPVYMFGIAVDDNRFLFYVTKQCSKSRCLLKFNYEINFEGIKMLLLRSSLTFLVN